MNSQFPLVMLPKRIVFVDDDQAFLNTLQLIMPRNQSREFISSPQAALRQLAQEAGHWRRIESLLSGALQARADDKGEVVLFAHDYFQDWRRFSLTSVLIVDQGMPGMDGLELLWRLGACPARRVLLTGQSDTHKIAIGAFNSGLIQKFIPKNTPQLAKEIAATCEEMHWSLCEHMGHMVRGILSDEQSALLYAQEFVGCLQSKVKELGWIEYVVVGQPFGLLGMPAAGPLQWLQLETSESLAELAEVASERDVSAEGVKSIRDCQTLTTMEIHAHLHVSDDKTLIPVELLCSSPQVFCAVIDLPVKVLTAKEFGVDDINGAEQLMQALLRDVMAAHRASFAHVGRDTDDALASAVGHLAATAVLSDGYEAALRTALTASEIPAHLSAQIEAALSAQRQDGSDHAAAR